MPPSDEASIQVQNEQQTQEHDQPQSAAKKQESTSAVKNPLQAPPLLSSSQQQARGARALTDGLSVQDTHNPATPFSSLEDAPDDTELSIQALSPEVSALGTSLDSDESTDLIPNPNQPIHPILRPELERSAWQKSLLYTSSGVCL